MDTPREMTAKDLRDIAWTLDSLVKLTRCLLEALQHPMTATPQKALTTMSDERALTIRQPWADLIMAGHKDVENRTWPVPSTLPEWGECDYHGMTAPTDIELVTDTPTVGPYWRHWSRDGYQCPVKLKGPFPFRLWAHAAKQVDWPAVRSWPFERYDDFPARSGDNPNSTIVYYREGDHRWDDPRLGVLLGSVTVTDCHHATDCEHFKPDRYCSRWAEPDVWHWTLADPVALPDPVPWRGRQGLWKVPRELLADVGHQLALAEGITA